MGEGRRAILGIDAAWTERQPSGVALAVEAEGGWRLAAVDASYAGFLARAEAAASGDDRPRGDKPDAAKLLEAARTICGRRVDLIAVDMPLSRNAIVGRRACDNQVSSKFGAAGAATHSPNGNRPGRLSDALRAAFEAEGYALRTTREDSSPLAYGLFEVYPHAALIRFFGQKRRLEYKAGKTLTYWPQLSRDDRRVKLRSVWTRIVEALDRRIAGVAAALPPPAVQANGWRTQGLRGQAGRGRLRGRRHQGARRRRRGPRRRGRRDLGSVRPVGRNFVIRLRRNFCWRKAAPSKFGDARHHRCSRCWIER